LASGLYNFFDSCCAEAEKEIKHSAKKIKTFIVGIDLVK